MKIAYLMNTYPMTSTTFIRREIEALEALSVRIERYAVRRWSEKLVDPRDLREAERTKYFLSGNISGLFSAFFQEAFANPNALWRGIAATWRLAANGGGISIKHMAYLLQAVYLRRQARLDDVQHVHAHFATNATYVAMLSHIMGGPTYSFTAHGPDEFECSRALNFDDKLSNASFAVAISGHCKAKLLLLGGIRHAKKIRIVHCGIDTAEFDISNVDDRESQTLICVGRLCSNKGQALIPAVVEKLKTDFPRLKVLLVGDGEARRDIEQEILDRGLEQHVEIRGWLPSCAVRALMRKSRALLLPSFAEGLPIVIMESLAMGRPVISTYVAGIPELLDSDCGWIVPAGSERHLEAGIRQALAASPAELMRLGGIGRARVVAEFDVKNSATALLGNFQKAVSAARGTDDHDNTD